MPEKELDPTSSVEALFGSRVRDLRKVLGWSQADLAAKVFVKPNRIAQIELATNPPPLRLTEQLDQVLNAKGALLELWPLMGQKSYEEWAEVFLQRQAEAVKIHEFSHIVPGLLQTPGYARAMLDSGRIFRERDLDETVQARLDRQGILTRDQPPWMWVILDEAALRRMVGGGDVMREQLQHLLEVGQGTRVDIQVLPFGETVPAALGGSLCLLSMPGGDNYAYTEGITGGRMIEGAEVMPYSVLYDRVHGNALGTGASADLIRKVLEEYNP